MIYQKGFSLLEVLISLMLVTSFSLLLLEHQGQAHQILTQLDLHAKAAQFHDQVDESLSVKRLNYRPPHFQHIQNHYNE